MMTFAAADLQPQQTLPGHVLGLCLLIQFPDVSGTLQRKQIEDFCNLRGYNEFDNHGSVCDYFFDNSDGKLRYTNVVTAYYTAAQTRDHYTDEKRTFPEGAQELIEEALDNLVATGFNLKDLTVDSHGHVLAVNAFYAGPTVNHFAQGLWPHQSSLMLPKSLGNGHFAHDYQITNMGTELSLGTFCHENGHLVCAYHDLYNSSGGATRGVGRYCLMCVGGRDTPKNPADICGYHKVKSGWADSLQTMTAGQSFTVRSDKNDFGILRRSPRSITYWKTASKSAEMPPCSAQDWLFGTSTKEAATGTRKTRP